MLVGTTTRTPRACFAIRFVGWWSVALLTLFVGMIARAAPQDAPRNPVAVCDGEHLWFFEASGSPDNARVVVLHHGPGDESQEAEQASIVEDMPEAALAVDGRLYCIFRGRREPAGGFQNRSVSTMRAESFDNRTRTWVYEPSPRARTVADLPGAGRIAGFVADGRDPVVLLVPRPKLVEEPQTASPDESQGESAAPPVLPRLLRLTLSQGWQEIALPDGVDGQQQLALVAGATPVLLVTPLKSSGANSLGYTLRADGTWSSEPIEIDAGRVIDSAVHEGQTFVALRSVDGGGIEIVLVRDAHAYSIMQIEQSSREVRLIDFGASLALAVAPPEGDRLIVTPIDVEKGELEPALEFQQRLRPALEDFSLLVLVGALLFASLIMFIFRPADPTRMTVTLPKGSRIAEPRRRIVALLIDLLPSALLASLILDVPFTQVIDITHMPMRAHHIEQSWPMLLMFIVCIAHSTMSELLWGRTLGKALLDCWVVTIDGKRAGVTGILVRNAMKFVALSVPLLFLFVYINQYRQRLGDLAGRTIVVTHHDGVEPSDASIDRDG